jgi:hypothetical protein
MSTLYPAALIATIHDPEGILYPHFLGTVGKIKPLFPAGIIGLSPQTLRRQAQWIEALEGAGFAVFRQAEGASIGEHFRAVFRRAVETCPAGQILHLADIDRLMFAAAGEYAGVFEEDVINARRQMQPVLFQRSERAWATHPENYRRVEGLVIEAGRLLFGKTYDFGWSHLVLTAGRLAGLLPHLHRDDFGHLIQIVLLLRQELVTRDVDWLAWEDPFILGREAQELWQERSQDPEETRKRLRGILPFFEALRLEVSGGEAPFQWERTGRL